MYLQTIPRAIWLHKSGKQLVQWPVVEVEKLRVNLVNLPPKVLKGGELLQINGVTAAQVSYTLHMSNKIATIYIVKSTTLVYDFKKKNSAIDK